MSSSKKLFMLRKHPGAAPVRGNDGSIIYYTSKKDAKSARVGTQCVSYGIEHRRFNPITQGQFHDS